MQDKVKAFMYEVGEMEQLPWPLTWLLHSSCLFIAYVKGRKWWVDCWRFHSTPIGPPRAIHKVFPRTSNKVCTIQKSIHKHALRGRNQCHTYQSLKLVSYGSLKLVISKTSIKDFQAPHNSSSILNLTQLSRTYWLSQ
jgi:hypothetical protein